MISPLNYVFFSQFYRLTRSKTFHDIVKPTLRVETLNIRNPLLQSKIRHFISRPAGGGGKGWDSLNLDEFGSASVVSVMTKHRPQPWRVHDIDNPVKYLKAWHVLDVE
jgi:hypothetical protein